MKQLTETFKLLSDDTRLRMLILLYQEELCVCELAGILGVPQPRISKNLAKLRDLDLVTDQRKEKFIFYTFKKDDSILSQILKDLVETMDLHPQFITDHNRLNKKQVYTFQSIAN